MNWVICLLLLGATESLSQEFNPAEHPEYRRGAPGVWEWVRPQEFVADPILGFRHNPGQSVRHTQRTRKKILWDVTLNFDELGFRITPQPSHTKDDSLIALFGCSFTLGTGLEDDQTLAAYLVQADPRYEVRNLAIGASSANMLLALTESPYLDPILKDRRGVLVYIPIESHLERATYSYTSSAWMGPTPYYEERGGALIRQGTLNEAFPFWHWIYARLWQLQRRFFPRYQMEFWPLWRDRKAYFCNLINTTAQRLHSQYPKISFVVMPHPMAKMNWLEQCVSPPNGRYIHSGFPLPKSHSIPGDGHPSAEFNKKFAPHLHELLRKFDN